MTKTKIGEANVTNGVATTTYTIPGDAATGSHTLTAEYIQNDTQKTGTGSTTLAIRIGTTITVQNVLASIGETATFTAQVKHTGNSNVPSGAGQVQFKLAGDNIGNPVTIGANGTATLEYTIPSTASDGMIITANFIQNETYAGSVSSNATLSIRGDLNLTVSPAYANRGTTVILAGSLDQSDAMDGTINVYIDNTFIGEAVINTRAFQYEYYVPNDATTGTHTVRFDYLQNDLYDAATASTTLTVRMPTSLTAVNVSGNAETTQESVPVTVNVFDENNNPVQSGSVGITIGNNSEVVIAVNASGQATTTYTIPSSATGTIQFTARFIEDNNYEASTMATPGVITIRKGTVITMESINAVRGDTVTLTATVKDDSNQNVTTGTVEFELE